jgi:hypothetical protein
MLVAVSRWLWCDYSAPGDREDPGSVLYSRVGTMHKIRNRLVSPNVEGTHEADFCLGEMCSDSRVSMDDVSSRPPAQVCRVDLEEIFISTPAISQFCDTQCLARLLLGKDVLL